MQDVVADGQIQPWHDPLHIGLTGNIIPWLKHIGGGDSIQEKLDRLDHMAAIRTRFAFGFNPQSTQRNRVLVGLRAKSLVDESKCLPSM